MSEIQKTWNLNLVIPNADDKKLSSARKELEEKTLAFIKKWEDSEDFYQDPKIMKQALDEYEEWWGNYGIFPDSDGYLAGDEGYYLWLSRVLDQDNPEINAKFNNQVEFATKLANDMQFFLYRISKIPAEDQSKFLNNPELADYKHFLERLFAEASHLLSEPEEKILSLKQQTSHANWVKMTSTLVSKQEREVIGEDGKKVVKGVYELSPMFQSKNKEVRKSAAEAYYDIAGKYAEVAEAEFNSILANKKIDDELRGYKSPEEAQHLGDDIDSKIVDSLIDSLSSRYDLVHRFYSLKAKLLGLEKLEMYERSLPYGEINVKATFDEASELVSKVFENLDPEFNEIFQEFLRDGHIDAYPRKGKYGNAFCVHLLKKHPIYVLLSHGDKFSDIRTLAHEMGHAINSYLTNKKQKSVYCSVSTATAEVASIFMEDFVVQEVMKTADDETKLALYMKKIDEEIGSTFRQACFYRFERDLHKNFREKGYLSAKEISDLYKKHNEEMCGDAVIQTQGSENVWVDIMHFRLMFYVYSYASGLLISKSLQNKVKEDHSFIEKVKEHFLSAGISDSPKNIFAKMGVDITDKKFWNKGIDEIEVLLNETEKLARKLGKIK